MCYTFDCATMSASCRVASNWDGEAQRCEFTPATLSQAVPSRLAALLAALRSAPRDSECTLLDEKTMDHEDYDTECSSQEVLVFLQRRWSPDSVRRAMMLRFE